MSQLLLKIKSKYILKSIFSFINYNRNLKLIKLNKQLQINLGLNIENYKKQTNYQYLTCQKLWKIEVEDNDYDCPIWDKMILYIISTIIALILFIYVIVFASLLVSKGAFNENNVKEESNHNYINIIDKINLSLFGLLPFIIISYCFSICYISVYENDYGIKIFIKKLITIVIGLLYLLYAALIIIKLYLSYELKKDKITWFMICDYILIILIILYLACIIIWICIYFKYSGELVSKKREIFLSKFRDINIYNYILPDDFIKMKDYEKRIYLINNINNYTIFISKNQESLISLINNYRKINNIEELSYDDNIKFKDLIFENHSEPI